MKKSLIALLVLCCTAVSALSQGAITLPIAANAVADLGNGPTKVRMIAGNASIFTSQGFGNASTSGSSTTLTLTGTPATPPIVGGLISGAGITSGTTVAAYNGTTGITLSAAMTVATSTPVAWGAACPSSAVGAPAQYIQASVMADYYIMYTQARVCAVSPGGPVNTLLIEPIFYDQATPNGGVALIPGTSVVSGGTSNGLLYDNAGVLGNLATANNGVLVTSSGGVPSVSSTLPSGLTAPNLSISGQLTSTETTGTAPFVVASTTNVANLNASSLSGATFASPGAIGGTTPNSAAFTSLTASTNVTFTAVFPINFSNATAGRGVIAINGTGNYGMISQGDAHTWTLGYAATLAVGTPVVSWTDNGPVTIAPNNGTTALTGALTISALPASAGGGGLYVCVDTSGVVYKKSSCP